MVLLLSGSEEEKIVQRVPIFNQDEALAVILNEGQGSWTRFLQKIIQGVPQQMTKAQEKQDIRNAQGHLWKGN